MSYGISCQIFGLISSFLNKRSLQVVLDEKSSKEYPVNMEFLKAPFLVLHFSHYILMTFLMMLFPILLSMLMILLYRCDKASELWQQLELASEIESDLQDTGA